MNRDTTIVDIAEKAGVSISTVSRVINNTGRIGEATRKKVLKIVGEMNYVQNNLAVSMVLKKTNMIGIIVPDIFTPFYAEVIQGAEAVAKAAGFSMIVFASGSSEDEERGFFHGRVSKMVDGIISIPFANKPDIYAGMHKPLVFVDRYVDNLPVDSVVIDNFGGAYTLTDHLIKRGHQRIAMVTGKPDQNFARERLWGYHQALADSGIKLQDKLTIIGGWYEQDGYDAISTLQSMDEKPTAVLAATCSLCTGCIKACRDLGIEIGEELSLVGFDDNELAKFVSPGVTVISRPTFEMGHVAAEMLLGRINHGQPGENARKTTLPVHLLERGSVKPLT